MVLWLRAEAEGLNILFLLCFVLGYRNDFETLPEMLAEERLIFDLFRNFVRPFDCPLIYEMVSPFEEKGAVEASYSSPLRSLRSLFSDICIKADSELIETILLISVWHLSFPWYEV
jgi:hypothetical protein